MISSHSCRLAEDREIVLFCDFHGHSRKQNVFIYGCDSMDNPLTRLKSRVFPKMLSKNAADMFTYKGSSFGVQKSKVSHIAYEELYENKLYKLMYIHCTHSP